MLRRPHEPPGPLRHPGEPRRALVRHLGHVRERGRCRTRGPVRREPAGRRRRERHRHRAEQPALGQHPRVPGAPERRSGGRAEGRRPLRHRAARSDRSAGSPTRPTSPCISPISRRRCSAAGSSTGPTATSTASTSSTPRRACSCRRSGLRAEPGRNPVPGRKALHPAGGPRTGRPRLRSSHRRDAAQRLPQRDGRRLGQLQDLHGAGRNRRRQRRELPHRRPRHLRDVRGFVSLTGSQRPEFRAGGNGQFGRRDFIWHGGGEGLLFYPKRNVLGLAFDFARGPDRRPTGESSSPGSNDMSFASNTSRDLLQKSDVYNLTVSDRSADVRELPERQPHVLPQHAALRALPASLRHELRHERTASPPSGPSPSRPATSRTACCRASSSSTT